MVCLWAVFGVSKGMLNLPKFCSDKFMDLMALAQPPKIFCNVAGLKMLASVAVSLITFGLHCLTFSSFSTLTASHLYRDE